MAKGTSFTEADLIAKGFRQDLKGNWLAPSGPTTSHTTVTIPPVIHNKQWIGDTEINVHAKPLIVFEVDPIGKPRMTQSDQWKGDPQHKDPNKRQRKPVTQYFRFKDKVVAQAKLLGFTLPENGFHVFFFIAMPHSWSAKKKAQMRGNAHQSKPDADNMVKALKDSLCKNDAVIWDYRITKLWGDFGKIVIYQMK